MNEYLKIIDENSKLVNEPGKIKYYHLYSSIAQSFPLSYRLSYPWDSHNISMQSEVLVRIPHLTPDFFVKCT
jgi:hypothetical protein